MKNFGWWAATGSAATMLVGAAVPLAAQASTRILLALEPAEPNTELLRRVVADAPGGRLANKPVALIPTRDLDDALRATRTPEYRMIVAPPHVAASALAHGLELIAATEATPRDVLVGGLGVKTVAELRGKRGDFPTRTRCVPTEFFLNG